MKKIISLCLITSALLLVGCNDDDDVSAEDYDQVVVKNDEAYWNAKDPSTYYLVDTVRWLQDPEGAGNANPAITRDFDAAILASIVTNMAGLGYTRVTTIDEDNLPDLIMSAQALATTSANVQYLWSDWYNWYGFYNPYYPGGVYPVYYEWSEGTVFIEMGDADSLDVEAETIDIVWAAGIDGFVRNTQQGNIDFINDRVEDAFESSESYLRK